MIELLHISHDLRFGKPLPQNGLRWIPPFTQKLRLETTSLQTQLEATNAGKEASNSRGGARSSHGTHHSQAQ